MFAELPFDAEFKNLEHFLAIAYQYLWISHLRLIGHNLFHLMYSSMNSFIISMHVQLRATIVVWIQNLAPQAFLAKFFFRSMIEIWSNGEICPQSIHTEWITQWS